ncbi:hypothetical protein [Algoriphagus sp.]
MNAKVFEKEKFFKESMGKELHSFSALAAFFEVTEYALRLNNYEIL